MGARRFNIHELISSEDELYLARLAQEISECHFRAPTPLLVRWGIPSASEADEPKLNASQLSKSQLADLEVALSLYVQRNFEGARQALEPFVELKHEEASKLYIKVLQRLKVPNWDQRAKEINRVSDDTLYVPPGSTEVIQGETVILIHQSLSKSLGMDAPDYVLRYVTHHEMLHQLLGTSADDPHPLLFRRIDGSFPQRRQAIEWLHKHGFTTIGGGPRA